MGAEEREEAIFASYGRALAQAVPAAIPEWVADSVRSRLPHPWSDQVTMAVTEAGSQAADTVGRELGELLALDLEHQWTNPLSIIRRAVKYPTSVLRAAGVAEADRDDHARRLEPDDVYDLTPASFAVFGPDVADLGLKWGAAKAHIHLRRRREDPS